MANLSYFIRCTLNLIKYGRASEYVARYGYVKTMRDILNIEVRSHWLIG